MPNKENNPNAQDQDPKLEKLRADRMAALRRGFERIKKGEYPGLAELGFLNTEATDLDKLSEEDLAKTKRLFGEIFGPDPEDSARGLLETQAVLDHFTYRRSKQNRPINLLKNVKLRLQMSPKFAGKELSPADYYPYVQAELLRQMARPDSELSYNDGKEKLEKISAQVAFPAPDPERQIAAIRGRTNRGGRNNDRILQELKLPRVGRDELGASLAAKDEAVINNLAQVYTYLFGNDERYQIGRFHFLTDQNGVRQVQTLDQVYDQQYQGPTKTPEAKLAFQKAMVVNALANGVNTEVAYEGRILSSGLRDACHGEASEEAMQEAAIRELTSSHNFSGSPVEGYNNVKLDYSIGQIGAAIGQMWQNIKDCDKWYIRSSERFINMKEHLEALNKLVNETWRQEIQAGRPITLEMMNELLEKADTLKGDIRHYLDGKLRDLTDDPSRRSDPESYEQRRIQANLNNLEALDAMTKTVESQVLKGISGKAREYFTEDLARLETRRQDLTAADAAEQKYNIQRSVDRQRQLSENAYTRVTFAGRENLLQAREMLLRNVERNYDAAYRAKLDRINDIREIADDAEIDQTIRSIPLSNAEIQRKRMHYYSKYAKLSPVNDSDRNALENYRYQLLPTDKKTLQANSGKNATVLPDPLREGISFLEDLYGFQPHIEKKYLYDPMALPEKNAKQPPTGRYISILTEEPVRHDFKAIYRGSDPAEAGDARLSEKDFAALAIAGARAPKSFALSGMRATLLKELQEQKITQEEYSQRMFELNDGFSVEEQRLRLASGYTSFWN